MSMEEHVQDVIRKLQALFQPSGFEAHPFKISWYNECVSKPYALDYLDNTLAFIVISTPEMFDKAFLKFITRDSCPGVRDPIDECVSHYFSEVKQAFPNQKIDVFHDYEMHHSRHPKVLVQTAGHVAGAARYYQRSDLTSDPWDKKKKIFGVSVHPSYGGWFALRGVLIFTEVQASNLQKRQPPDVVPDNESRIELLRRFNDCWRDNSFRDIIDVHARYSDDQILYFNTPPKERSLIIESLRTSSCLSD